MSLNLQMLSDEQLNDCLNKVTRVPSWEIKNTQSEREHKRILLMQQHQRRIVERQRKQLKHRRIQRRHDAEKKKQINESTMKKDDGLEF